MKKVLITLLLSLVFCNIGFAETYYFKECKLTEILYADYLIDIDKKIILTTQAPEFSTFGRFTLIDKFIISNQRLPNKKEVLKYKKMYYKKQPKHNKNYFHLI